MAFRRTPNQSLDFVRVRAELLIPAGRIEKREFKLERGKPIGQQRQKKTPRENHTQLNICQSFPGEWVSRVSVGLQSSLRFAAADADALVEGRR